MKRISLVALLIQLFSVLSHAPAQAAVEVTIAYQGPMTGPESAVGVTQATAVKYAMTKFNATSANYKVQLTIIDDQGYPEIADQVAPTTAADKRIVGVVGPAYSGATVASLPYYKAGSLVMISPSASRISLTASPDLGGPVFHRVIGVNFGAALANHSVKGIVAPKVFIVDSSDSYADLQIPIMRTALKALNAEVLGSEEITSGTTDFSASLAKIKGTGANVVIYVGSDSGAAAFARQLRDSGSVATLSVGNIEFGKTFTALAGKAAEGARITTNAIDSISSISPTLEADFKKTTGAKSDTYSVEAIDATNIMLSCIDKGNITRDTLLKCVKGYKGKSFLGAEISFDSSGDVSGNYTYVGEVKDAQIQFSDPIINEPIVRKSVESAEANIDLKSISARTISPGDKVSWNFEVTVQPGYFKYISLQVIDTEGQPRNLNEYLASRFKGGIVEKAETFDIDVVLQTHAGLLPGKYLLVNFCVIGTKQVCVTDPNYASRFNPNGQNRSLGLEEFSFEVKDSGSNLRESPLKISKISTRKSSYSPGEVIQYEVEAIGKMTLGQANLNLISGGNGLSASCQPTYASSNCTFTQDKEKGITKIIFSFPIPEDLPAGKVELSSIYLSSKGTSTSTSDSDGNTTASWNTAFRYADKSIQGGDGQILNSDPTFDFSVYSATILDSGGVEKRPPTWSNLAWKINKVNAGSEAVLTLDINGYQRYFSALYLYSLISTSGKQIQLKDMVPSLVSVDSSGGIYPLKKSGQYQIKVTIPRSATPGSYRIGQLTVYATNCQANTQTEWLQKANSGTGQCSGLNSWQTTYNSGYLSSSGWPGSEKTATLTLEILPALKPQFPSLKIISNGPDTVKMDYSYDDEVTCEFSSDKGSLIHQEVIKGQSNDGVNHLIITELKPDSALKLKGTCTGVDGLKGDSSVVEYRTAKPTPPATPKVIPNEIGVETAKFDFWYREGFKYQVKTNSGDVIVSNGTIDFKRLSPNSKVEFQILITDSYAQTTTSDPIVFTTNSPELPTAPKIQLISKSQTRVLVSINFEQQNEYEVTATSGIVTITGGQITISSLKAGEQFTLLVAVKDKYQQSVATKQSFQSELPLAPRTPSLISKSILSDELIISIKPQEGIQMIVKSTSGVVIITGNTLRVTNLTPKSLVTITAYNLDQFGQSSSITTKNYTTRAAAPQKTLTCTNGTTTKIVIGTNPICPIGFKKK